MKKPRTYVAELAAAEAALRAVLARLAAVVRALPDNPRITRHVAHSFTLSSKDLGANWTPGYHDFRHQYGAVARALAGGNVMTAADRLGRMIADGRLPHGPYRTRRPLHPDVVAHLKTLVGGRRTRKGKS